MDNIDKKILHLLQHNARTPLKYLANKVFLSSPAVSARIDRLEKAGVITGYHAGINPEVAYSLSDAEIQYCEVLTDLRELNRYRSLCELLFLNLVHEKKERERMKNAPIPRKGSPELTIESCKEYIACHLHEKILIRDIAKELFVNADYLSDIFHKKTGTTITQYIRQHKVQLICNMLTYSDYSYLEIATYFGYSSKAIWGPYSGRKQA
jgi:DNA-binding Lrp family transcriptional regulator